MIVGLKSPNTIIAGYLYLCLWQITLTQIYHVTNGLCLMPRHYSDRARRGVSFDWQKDEDYSNEEDNVAEKARTIEEDFSDSILWSRKDEPAKIVSHHQSKKLEIDFGQVVLETTQPPTTTQKPQTKRPTKSDIKTILWDQGVEATDDDEPMPQVTTPKLMKKITGKPKTPTTIAAPPPDDPSKTEGEKVDGSNEPAIFTSTTTTTTTSSSTGFNKSASRTEARQQHIKVKVTTAATSVPTSTPSGDNKPLEMMHPTDSLLATLSANEDMIRTYTLNGTEKYGVGSAKPRAITKKLAEMRTTEYSEDNEEGDEQSTFNVKVVKDS